MSSIAVVGSGGVGGLYGAMLAAAGHEVHFLVRSAAAEIRRRGWILESVWGDLRIDDPLVHEDVTSIPPCDYLIVALKSTENAALAGLLPPLSHDATIAVVLQNGLHVEEATEAAIGPGRTVGGCCFLCSNKISPGHIRHLDYGRIELGGYRGEGSELTTPPDAVDAVAELLSAAKIPVEVSRDLYTTRWRKLMWNIPFNGLSVALDASTSEIMADGDSRRLSEDIMREVESAATACGAAIDAGHVSRMMEHTEKMVPYDSSMRLDYLAGRPMELEYIYARPMRDAARAGVRPLKIEMLHQQLQFFNRRANGRPLGDGELKRRDAKEQRRKED